MAKSTETDPLVAPIGAANELHVILALSGPLVAIQLLEVLPSSVNGMLTGHLATQDSESQLFLAAIDLGELFFTVFVYSVAIGVSTAMDALCSQAYGKGSLHELGTSASRQIALAAQHLTRYTVLGIPFVFGYEFLKRVLQGQTILNPILAAITLANLVNGLVSYTLMYHTPLGYAGSALSAAFLNAAGCAVMLHKVCQLEPWHSHFEWSADCHTLRP
ncbi:hypothetical protein SPRG_07763 [Saprolegnia parasitica CBS 223.65]|uniref:Uncharacterized protein n=1 Tax=Saprolegnia parasitica (strain CBS 223.65) TaxID=695850 RepID=A0A067CJR4_SAPPC|nr:hypothetical protein SPRG_07763 [Saprolegnia parasitica CBS 223.65]KDO27052.1 hypothetical protein SPRG_07763 [Saprolegnia parasitica CBS 223.65]|eukprot:XP_012202147.1 hypothetical protein SPRG_07763 [Saprolegnia parasitica CBS 223.65]